MAEAATWKDTPYDARGANSIKGVLGDCSGSTFQIYKAAGFPYPYQMSGAFLTYARHSGLFRALSSGEQPQDGDILAWPGHMAIYSTFVSDPANAMTVYTNPRTGGTRAVSNDMWTAGHASKDGKPSRPYGAADSATFRPDHPTIFRYQH